MKHIVDEVVLANGAKGLLIDIPDASVMTYQISFRAGDFLMPKEKWEVPHLMEHVLLGANEQQPKARIFQEEFEKNGAYCNASTSSYDITYEAECADFEWERILNLLTVAISKPLFLEDEFEAEFGNVREELVGRSNNHFRHLSLALRQAYGFHTLTDQERLLLMDNVVLKDLQNHYKETHFTNNMRFVFAGKLPANRRQAIIEVMSTLALPPGEQRIKLPVEKPTKLNQPLYIHNDSVPNLYFYIDTFMDRRFKEPELDSISLLNSMLTETLHSRIFGAARENGLVYHMSSGHVQARKASGWWFGAQVMPKNAEALLDIIVRELKIIKKGGFSKDDIAAAKQYALGKYQRSGQTVMGTADGYSNRYFFDDHIEDYYQVPKHIAAVTKAGMVEIARDLFAENIWGLGGLGNCQMMFLEELEDRIRPLWV